ncbi:MAG TPA: MgtC/SapB family protein [Candidatus Borkfalkia stercoripullorum]|nr:MgtC/SapB family protein [Candidatus Borkfalkia stercoripullorum]
MLEELKYLISILIAVVLGFAIGFERKLRFKEAGIRTHTIVCVGSALIMVVSKYGFGDSPDYDASRVAAQIVSGIGFLGAGIIVYRKHEIRGLTTAAGVWATAGVGMAAGAELYIVAAGAAVIIIAVQCLLHAKCKLFQTKKYTQIKIRFQKYGDEDEKVKELFQADAFCRMTMERKGDKIVCTANLNIDKEISRQRLNEIMSENPFIHSIEFSGED